MIFSKNNYDYSQDVIPKNDHIKDIRDETCQHTASATKPTTQWHGTALKPSAISGNDDFVNGHSNQLMMGRLEE